MVKSLLTACFGGEFFRESYTADLFTNEQTGRLGSWSKKMYWIGTHFYQVGHGSHLVVISGTRMGTFMVPEGLIQ